MSNGVSSQKLTLTSGSVAAFMATRWKARATRSRKSVAEYPSVLVDSSVKLSGVSVL